MGFVGAFFSVKLYSRGAHFLAAAFLTVASTLFSSSCLLLACMGKAAHLPDHVPHKPGVLGEVSAEAAMPRFTFLSRPTPMGHQRPWLLVFNGCCVGKTSTVLNSVGTFYILMNYCVTQL